MMSDENSGTASSAEPMIPKARLDELIAERNSSKAEVQFLQGQLAEIARQRQQVARPEVDDPEMEELKRSNPGLYKKLKKQEYETKQLRAGFSTVIDANDRLAFLQEAGEAGKKRMAEVEQILNHERTQNRNFNVTRVGIFNFLQGQDLIKREQSKASAPQAKAPIEDGNVPSSDARSATTISGGTASSQPVAQSREERIKSLENVEF